MASSAARNIVRNIIGTSRTPLTTREIYDLAGKKFPKATGTPPRPTYGSPSLQAKPGYERKEPPVAPRAGHPIPSMIHLKTRVLPDLVARSEVEKVLTTRTGTAMTKSAGKKSSDVLKEVDTWVWRFHTKAKGNFIPKNPDGPEPPCPPRAAKPAPKTHAEMYPAPENVHLNKRRRRARPAKVERTQTWVAELKKAVEVGKRKAAEGQAV